MPGGSKREQLDHELRNSEPLPERELFSTVATYRVGLSPAEYERLALLAEEMGEAIHVIGKVLRHGYESHNPITDDGLTNRRLLENELGDVRHAMIRLCEAGDLNKETIHAQAESKRTSVKRWLHFND